MHFLHDVLGTCYIFCSYGGSNHVFSVLIAAPPVVQLIPFILEGQ